MLTSQLFRGLLNEVALSNADSKFVTPDTFQLSIAPLNDVAPWKAFLSVVVAVRSGASVADELKFAAP